LGNDTVEGEWRSEVFEIKDWGRRCQSSNGHMRILQPKPGCQHCKKFSNLSQIPMENLGGRKEL